MIIPQMKNIKSIYSSVYQQSPIRLQGWLTQLAMASPWKPTVKKCNVPFKERFPSSYTGAVVFSADFEMAWAWRYAKSDRDPVKYGLKARSNIPILLQMFEEYSVPVTWATVGHLFLNRCTKNNGASHPELKRPPFFENKVWQYKSGDWYDHDPCSDVGTDPAWYAPDLLQKIIGSKIGHEIGCHTFSHIDCSSEHCTAKILDDEIGECLRLARKIGVNLKSMVFPGGTNGHYEILKKHGLTNYRINSEYDLFYPEKDKFGLWALPSTASIQSHEFGWDLNYYVKYFAQYINKAISTGTVCHLWFHPSVDNFCLNEIFPRVLKLVRQKADQMKLWIVTMGDLADYCTMRSEE